MSRIEVREIIGEFYTAAHWLTENGYADQLVQMIALDRSRTLAILRVPSPPPVGATEGGIYWVTGAPGTNWIVPGQVAIAELRNETWTFMGGTKSIRFDEARVIAGPVEPPTKWPDHG